MSFDEVGIVLQSSNTLLCIMEINRDCAGQERFRTITTAYYRGVSAVLLVYDITDEESFQKIPTFMEAVKQHAPEG